MVARLSFSAVVGAYGAAGTRGGRRTNLNVSTARIGSSDPRHFRLFQESSSLRESRQTHRRPRPSACGVLCFIAPVNGCFMGQTTAVARTQRRPIPPSLCLGRGWLSSEQSILPILPPVLEGCDRNQVLWPLGRQTKKPEHHHLCRLECRRQRSEGSGNWCRDFRISVPGPDPADV